MTKGVQKNTHWIRQSLNNKSFREVPYNTMCIIRHWVKYASPRHSTPTHLAGDTLPLRCPPPKFYPSIIFSFHSDFESTICVPIQRSRENKSSSIERVVSICVQSIPRFFFFFLIEGSCIPCETPQLLHTYLRDTLLSKAASVYKGEICDLEYTVNIILLLSNLLFCFKKYFNMIYFTNFKYLSANNINNTLHFYHYGVIDT